MASLVYDLPIAEFDARPFERAAEYASSGDFGQFSVRLTEDELLGEFGVVPQSIRVVVRVGNDIPPGAAWVNSPYRSDRPETRSMNDKICIGCDQPEGEKHKPWCPVMTGTLSSLPRGDSQPDGER